MLLRRVFIASLLILGAAITGPAQKQSVFTLLPPSVGAGSPDLKLRILLAQGLGLTFDPNESFTWRGPTNPPLAEPVQLNMAQLISAFEFDLTIPAVLLAVAGNATIFYHDSDGGTTQIPFTITAPLMITTTRLPLAGVGVPYSIALQASGGTGVFHWSVASGALPSGLSLTDAGVLSGTPQASGTFQLTFKVSDSAGATDQKSFALSIETGPTAVDDVYAVMTGAILTVPASGGVGANDLEDPSTQPTFSFPAQPSHGNLTGQSDGSFVYTPAPGFVGQDNFHYQLQTSVGSSTATVTIKVAPSDAQAACTVNPSQELVSNPSGVYSSTVMVTYQGAPLAHAPIYTYIPDYPLPLTEYEVSEGFTDGLGRLPIDLPVDSFAPGSYTLTAAQTPPGFPLTKFHCAGGIEIKQTPMSVALFCNCVFASPSETPPGCEKLFALDSNFANPGGLAMFRQFRDKVLKPNPRGAEYARLYYRFRPELWKMILAHPSLLWRAREILQRQLPLVQELLRGEKTSISASEAKDVDDLLLLIENSGSSELRQAVDGIRHDIFDGKLLASFGVNMVDGSKGHAQSELRQAFWKLPLHFERLPGRGPGYRARGAGYDIELRQTEARLRLRDGSSPIRMRLIGAAKARRAAPESPLEGASNYLIGPDPKNWRMGVTQYERVRYERVYPGIDLIYYGSQQELEYDLVAAPGASPDQVILAFSGADKVSIDSAGDLKLARDVYLRRPVAYQEIGGVRHPVTAEYVVHAGNRVGFRIGEYDRKQALVIDPVMSYASLFGGSGLEFGMAIAVDASGNAYVTGATTSTDLITSSPLQAKHRGGGQFHADAFVTKFDPTGSKVVYSTYFGGSDDDIGIGIAVDAEGNAYITGATRSSDFPSVQPIQAEFGGAGKYFKTDAFVLKLDSSGSKLLYSTYLGGSGDDGARGIALDSSGNVYIAGITSSTDLPTKNAFQSTNGGGKSYISDGFVAKINAAGNELVYSTYLGGKGDDAVGSLAVDAAGNAYVTGFTYSDDFPLMNPLQKKYGGSADAFVAKLDPTGSALLYSTYLGGASDDFGSAIAIDLQGNAYVTGFTGSSSDFPIVKPAQPKFGSSDGLGFDSFVAKLNPDGSQLVYSTFLGGSGRDYAYAIAVDQQGNTFVAGETESTDFASSGALQPTLGGRLDAFLAKLNATGDAFEYRTYLGGASDDGALSLTLDASGNVYLTGGVVSSDAPSTYGAFQTILQGPMDSFIAKIGPGTAPPAFSSVSAASFTASTGLAAQSIASGFGTGFTTKITAATTKDLPTELDGVSVAVKDASGMERLAPLFLVAGGQINYLVPEGTQTGLSEVTVRRDSKAIATGVARILPVAPSLFSANSDGHGVAAGFALHIASDGTRTTQALYQCGTAPGSCTEAPIDLSAKGDQVYLLLFGTGIRNHTSTVTAKVGEASVPVPAALAQGQFSGLDQVNLGPLPQTLDGKGKVDVRVTVDGKVANTVTVSVR